MVDETPTELTCYLHPGWAPRIRPAAPGRKWMDETPERFAYRCLPLAVANAHGWEIGSPCSFEARWDGGCGVDAVTIRADPNSEPHRRPVSLFGDGTLTFHVEGLFRTSPGWNLWIGAPPNMAKDAIVPLSGLVETDWSPYTFTMNWRFTRPGHWVSWAEDEPFCHFFPVHRHTLSAIQPCFRPLSDNPTLEDQFISWSVSRTAFQEAVRLCPPSEPTDRWQKLYYRGILPDQTSGTADHQTKLRICLFEGTRSLGLPLCQDIGPSE